MAALLVQPGQTVPVGTALALLAEPGESLEEVAARGADLAPPAPVAVPAPHFLLALHEKLHVDIPESDYRRLTTLDRLVSYLTERV